jgi:hypothetical protein
LVHVDVDTLPFSTRDANAIGHTGTVNIPKLQKENIEIHN